MSFYRTYRPQIIQDLDTDSVRVHIESLLTKPKNQLPHAYLFSGPKGTGKTSTARIIAKLFNCSNPAKSGSPCGKCEECKSIADGRYLDVIEMDAASNRGIDEIRSLRDSIALTPSSGRYKIFIIDEVHMLTNEAFNALLKTLEEPPLHAVFVLATTDPQKIPATVVSRCQLISFGKADTNDLIHALKRIVKTEKMIVEEEAISLIAQYADGSFRDAVKMLEQLSFHKSKIDLAVAQKILAVAQVSRRDEFLSHLLARDAQAALRDVQALIKEGNDVKTFLVDCLHELQKQFVATQTADLGDVIRRLSAAYAELRTSPIPELPLQLVIVEYCEEKEASSPVIPANAAEIRSLSAQNAESPIGVGDDTQSLGLLTLEKLTEHWHDVIDELKPYNHSVAAVCRSARPKAVKGGIVVIEAFYKFHQEKLSEMKTRDMIGNVLKKLFGEKVKVEVTLGKK